MKRRSRVLAPQKRRFKITGFAFIWLVLFSIAVIFTQALRNSVSYIFFIVISALPLIDLVYTLAVSGAIRVSVNSSASVVEKNAEVLLSLSLKNASLLPVLFTEALITVPSDDGSFGVSIAVSAPLSSFGSYDYKRSVSFPYRGKYVCGVSAVYTSGIFRFFRIRTDRAAFAEITVMPRRLLLEPTDNRYVTQTNVSAGKPSKGSDSTELTEIKEYIPGDPIKNIHWKLSTKAQELMTKHFGAENGMNMCIIADLGRHYDVDGTVSSDINEYCDDAVVELSVGAALAELSAGKAVTLICPGKENGGEYVSKRKFETGFEFDSALEYYATLPMCEPTGVSELLSHAEEGDGGDIIFITAFLDDDTVFTLCDAASDNRAITLFYFEPYEKAKDADALRKRVKEYENELTSSKIEVRLIGHEEMI